MTRNEVLAVIAAARKMGKRPDLRGADMRNEVMSGADMRNTDMSGANMSGSDMSGSNMRYTDMSGANMSGADMRNTDMRYTKMRGVIGYIVGPQRSDGYRIDARLMPQGWCVVAGCLTSCNLSLDAYEARARGYDCADKRDETLVIIAYLRARIAMQPAVSEDKE